MERVVVSIGILAHNEAASIERTLLSLLEQDLFSEGSGQMEVCELIVVPNGCTDDTAEIARSVLAEAECDLLKWDVKEVEEPGKSNAWNLYVHEFSRRDADVLFLMDADIWFESTETLRRMLETLAGTRDAGAVSDKPVMHIAVAESRTLWNRVHLWASRHHADRPAAVADICGQLYCGRPSALRGIWMPKGLPVEDGFVRAMIATDMFRSPVDTNRVVRAEGAWHVFEEYTEPLALFRHMVRLCVGTALNCYLCWDFLLFAVDPQGPGAGHLIRARLADDPEWYAKLMHNTIRNHGLWVLPRGVLFGAFSPLARQRSPLRMMRGLPRCLVRFLAALPVLVVANWKLRGKTHGIGYW